MADPRMISRLADLAEFRELHDYILEREQEDVKQLARKTYALPEEHDALEWHKLKAYYAGARAVLDLPYQQREKLDRKDAQ